MMLKVRDTKGLVNLLEPTPDVGLGIWFHQFNVGAIWRPRLSSETQLRWFLL